MTVFGALRNAFRGKAAVGVTDTSLLSGGRGWYPLVREPFTGAWQRNMEIRQDLATANYAVYACITLIAADVGKLDLNLVERDADGIWEAVTSPAFSPVLAKPNDFQTRQQFLENWMVSKLSRGNTYVLKGRDNRGVVTRLWILDPSRVKPLITTLGDVYYQLSTDNLAGIEEAEITVPASEIIHDRCTPLYHPLCGVPPLIACGLAAMHSMKLTENMAQLFANMSQPGGILSAPDHIEDDTAKRIKDHFDQNYSGANAGKVAVLGDGLKYEQLAFKPVDAQVVEQFKLTGTMVCAAFHVPPFKVHLGELPAGQKASDQNQIYYSDCLQAHMTGIENGLDHGLKLTEIVGKTLGTMFDTDGLLRMDQLTQMQVQSEGVKGGIFKPNEARRTFNRKPVVGGDTPYMQQQNFALSDLFKRSQQEDPFKTAAPPAPAPAAANDDAADPAAAEDDVDAEDEDLKSFAAALEKGLAEALHVA